MKIIRLEIHGFGKFQNYTLQLSDGFQVIYGENEAGKTTLQSFILAMLFGMKKPGKKRSVYSEDHTHYQPWSGEVYGGTLYCKIGDQDYRIQRNFQKNREDCKIYLALTGEEITNRFPEDARKERLFLQTLLGLDELMFKNALCLGEGLRGEWDDWRRETAPKLISGSYLQTADQVLIERAESVIQQKMDEIGTERAESKLLGQAAAKRQHLERSIQQEEAQEEAMEQVGQELEQWDRKCQHNSEVLAERKETAAGMIQVLLDQFIKEKEAIELATSTAASGFARRASFLQTRDHLQQVNRILLRKAESYRSLFQERNNYRTRVDVLKQDREQGAFADRYQNVTEQTLQRIEELDEKLSAGMETEFGKTDPIGARRKPSDKGGRQIQFAGGLGVLLGMAVWYLLNPTVGIVVTVGGFLVLVAGLVKTQIDKKAEKLRVQDQNKAKQAEVKGWEEELLQLLAKLDADTPRQARNRWQQILQMRERLQATQHQVDWFQQEIEKVNRRLQGEIGEIRKIFDETEYTHSELGDHLEPTILEQMIQDWETEMNRSFTQLDSANRIKELIQETTRWQRRLDELGIAPDRIRKVEKQATVEQVEEEIQTIAQLERQFLTEWAKRAELDGRVQSLRQGRAKTGELRRELNEWRGKEAKWLHIRKALEITQETFGEIRETLYREHAPKLVKKVSELAHLFTNGHYCNLRVDGQLAIRVIPPDSGYLYESKELSKGTNDQLSFALSLAVAESIIKNGDKMPLLIDEPFLHYDNQRLKRTLQYLMSHSGTEQRQTLFFTHRLEDVENIRQICGPQLVVYNLTEK